MGTFRHKLKANHRSHEPRQIVYFDTEATIETDSRGVQHHSLDFGVACFERRPYSKRRGRCWWWMFDQPGGFWDEVIRRSETDRPLYLIAHNVGYDLRILDMWGQLQSRGYSLTGWYVNQAAVIFRWKKDKHKLVIVDSLNWLDGSLASWGERVGLPKGKDEWQSDDLSTRAAYCSRDVEILRAIVQWWFRFRADHDCGVFSPTKASQALNCYRHRFMPRSIYIHDGIKTHAIERAGYYGGRVECYRVGRMVNGPYYKLDVNSLYPYCMRNWKLPYINKGSSGHASLSWFLKWFDKYWWIAEVLIQTDEPAYPVRRDGETIYPTGTFRTVLPHPELQHAVERGRVKDVGRVAVYQADYLFGDYVDYWQGVKQHYKERGDRVYYQLAKYMQNCLYGKFAAYSEKWSLSEPMPDEAEGYNVIPNLDDGTEHKRYRIGREAWEMTAHTEAPDSFPAIAAGVTSAGRMVLWGLQQRAGREHVFYSDTDSLIVDQWGRDNLADMLHPSALGCLDVEDSADVVGMHGPKDYYLGEHRKIKGVRPEAGEVSWGLFYQQQWEGLRGSMASATVDEVRIFPTAKYLERSYRKGYVLDSGWVEPWALADASPV